uniref:Aquaporin n=1 Tax=Arion vulgaris TaxID=1028688 RepID=A0A0B6ZT33_9EUPU
MIFSWQLVVICLSWTMQKKEKQVLFKLETTKSGDSERSLISEMDKTANENIDNSNGNRNSNITMSESEALINRSVSEPNRFLSSITEGSFENYIRPCFTEFLGVALFVFIGTTAICSGRAVEGVALAHGLTIALLITATGSISGGHFNPAVTLGVLIGGAVSPVTAVLYVVSQMIGAIFGSLFTLVRDNSVLYSH